MELPARLGKYLLEEFLDGGEAEAYRARDTETGRMVVVKILTEAACADAEAKERFLEEADAYDHGESDNGQPFLVTEASVAPGPALRIVARKPARPARAGSPVKWIVTAVLAAVILAGAGWHFRPRPKAAPAAPVLAATMVTPSGAMVLVPAGNFLFGEARDPIWLPAFYIDRTEVTNAAYAAFCKAAAHDPPPDFPPDKPDYPVVNVSMADAQEFAAWAGKRIPSGREWEKAARGEKGQAFPWGDQPDRSRANVGLVTLLPADAFPKGASPYGALQMIGNAWEWVNDMRSPTQEDVDDFAKRVQPPLASDELWYAVRGGGFDSQQLTPLLMWDSKAAPQRWRSNDIGFRCVKDAR
jgi:formylglycine-generating enzyme required for sulfatase activity